MDLREDITANFEFLNIKPSDDILNKCIDICTKHNVDAEAFVNEWMAYTASFLRGDPPTIESLDAMERKIYAKDKHRSAKKKQQNTPKSSIHGNGFSELHEENPVHLPDAQPSEFSTPKRPKKPVSVASADKSLPSVQNVSVATDDISPSLPQSSNYDTRTDSGKVVCSFNPQEPTRQATFKGNGALELDISSYHQQNAMGTDILYMYDLLKHKACAIDSITEELGHSLIEKYSLTDVTSFMNRTASVITTYGRICYDEMEGKINADNLFLEGTDSLTKGQSISLNISRLQKYALFAGQTVAVKGLNVGKSFIAQTLYSDLTLPLPEVPVTLQQLPEPLQIVIAAGPFTLSENILYKPLNDLIKYVKNHKPHVVILIGPILDDAHVEKCVLSKPIDEFQEEIIKSIVSALNGLEIQLIVVSSQKDVCQPLVYPTPQYSVEGHNKNLHCFPDPSMISINGIVVGVTSVDTLLHLAKEELSSYGGDKIGRLISYVLSQQCFYPICPPDKDLSLDYELLRKFGMMSVTPHILILPSNLKHFVKVCNGCLVINPERLVKGNTAGTFAKLEVRLGQSSCITDDVACEIVTI